FTIMKKIKNLLLFLLFLILIGCSTNVTEEDLVGGTWVGTAGYEDGEPAGESNCLYYIIDGLEFKDEDTVYSEAYEKDFEYKLADDEITFMDENHHDSYYIDWIDDNKIGLTGGSDMQKNESCFLERK